MSPTPAPAGPDTATYTASLLGLGTSLTTLLLLHTSRLHPSLSLLTPLLSALIILITIGVAHRRKALRIPSVLSWTLCFILSQLLGNALLYPPQ